MASKRVRVAYLKRMIGRVERETAKLRSSLSNAHIDQATAEIGIRLSEDYVRRLTAELVELERDAR